MQSWTILSVAIFINDRMAATSELSSLVARLEAVTNKLEGIAAGSGGDDAGGELLMLW